MKTKLIIIMDITINPKRKKIIKCGSALFNIFRGPRTKLPITAKTHRNLGDGGFYFNADRYVRADGSDYICAIRIKGEYHSNFPLKNEVSCNINVLIVPIVKDGSVRPVERRNYYIHYKETTRNKFYHQDIEDLCDELVGSFNEPYDIDDCESFERDDFGYYRINEDNKKLFIGWYSDFPNSELGYGWGLLLDLGEELCEY